MVPGSQNRHLDMEALAQRGLLPLGYRTDADRISPEKGTEKKCAGGSGVTSFSTPSLSADELAEAAARKAAQAPHGQKRDRERVAKKARLVALALNVKAMRISSKGDAHE